jgi:hypothetical protein
VKSLLGVQHCFALLTAEAGDVNIHAVVTRLFRLDQRGCANPTAEASDINIQTVVKSLLEVQHCFALLTAEAGDVNIHAVVARLFRLDQRGCAKPTAEASDINIQTVVKSLLEVQHCFALRTAEAGDVNIRNIHAVVARLFRLDQGECAKPTAEASDVNIETAVTRVLGVEPYFARHTAEAGDANIHAVVIHLLRLVSQRRCGHSPWRRQYPDGCTKSAQGATSFCKAHGGGRRCTHSSGCDRYAVAMGKTCKKHGR